MIQPKITLFIILAILATLTGSQGLLHNLLQNLGRRVTGLYRCTQGIFQPVMPNTNPTPNNNFDIRIELKDGRAKVWLPENQLKHLSRLWNTPRPFSQNNPWAYNTISFPNNSPRFSRALIDTSPQQSFQDNNNNQLFTPIVQNSILPTTNENSQQIDNFQKYPVLVPPPFLQPPLATFDNLPDQILNPPQVSGNENFQTNQNSFHQNLRNFNADLDLPFDFQDVNNLADSGSTYRTIPFSEYKENDIGNGLLVSENVNSNVDLNAGLRNRPTAPIDTGYGQIPLYK